MERIVIDYFRCGEALKKERASDTDPMPCLQSRSFNTSMKLLFAELKARNANLNYEKDMKELREEVAKNINQLHVEFGQSCSAGSKKKRVK